MKQRGRKSLNALTMADASIHLMQRPGPPLSLTEEQRQLWMTITNPLPADWFTEDNAHLLEEHCITTTSIRFINVGINAIEQTDEAEREEGWRRTYFGLLKERNNLARLQLTQARSLRLNPASRTRPKEAGTEVSRPRTKGKLWD